MALEFKQEDSYCLKDVWAAVLPGLASESKKALTQKKLTKWNTYTFKTSTVSDSINLQQVDVDPGDLKITAMVPF